MYAIHLSIHIVPKCTPGVTEFEARKRRKVNLISIDMVIKIKAVKFELPRNTLISPFTVTRFTPRNSVQKCMNTSRMFDNIMYAHRYARLLMKKYDILIFHKG